MAHQQQYSAEAYGHAAVADYPTPVPHFVHTQLDTYQNHHSHQHQQNQQNQTHIQFGHSPLKHIFSMRSPSSSSGYHEGHTKKSRKGRKRSASIATSSAHHVPPVTSRSAQSSGTYADATVAATLSPETPPLQLDPSHGSANTTPNRRSGSSHHGKQKRKHSHHRRGRSGGGSRAAVAAGSKELSPMSTHTLTEEGEDHSATALASYDSSGGDVGLKKKSSCASEMMLVMEALEPLTVAVATTVPAAEEDVSNQHQHQQPQLATLAEEEDDVVAEDQSQALGSNIQQQSAADLEALTAEAPEQDRCTAHPGARNDLWCQTCRQAICNRCIEGPAATGSSISSGIGHRMHSVVKLAAAYDDTYETIEMLQLKLLRNLAETRNRTTLLDSAVSDLDASFVQASNQLEQNTQADAERIEAEFHAIHADLDSHRLDCQHWRSGIEETLSTVQSVMDGVTQAQAVAQCDALVSVMETAARARPQAWASELPPSSARLMECVRPSAFFFALRVPSVMELGRKRGHVRVAGTPTSAHGAVWTAEARRSRNALGEPCLAVAVTCVEGPSSSSSSATMMIGVDVAASCGGGESGLAGERRHFAQWHAASWTQTQTHTFTVCTLDELERSGALASSSSSSAGNGGDVVVRIGVRPESFRALASVQSERIRVLEERLRKATEKPADSAAAALDQTVCSVRPSRRRRSDARGWATSPRASGRRSDVHQMFARPGADDNFAGGRRPSLAPTLPLPVLPPQQLPPSLVSSLSAQQQLVSSPTLSPPLSPSPSSIGGGPGDLLDQNQSPSQSQFHRRAVSLTTKLRRQPPIPFPLAMRTRSVQSSVTMMHVASGANGSQTSVASKSSLSALARLTQPFGSSGNDDGDDNDGKPGMLRRLSGWMRSTAAEGRTAAHRARRTRRLASSGGNGGGSSLALGDDASLEEEEIDDWTFLDGEVMSPQQKQPLQDEELVHEGGVEEDTAAPCKPHAGRCLAPSVPLPPLPLAEPPAVVADDDDIEAGFAFDGAADIEREQAEVDARARRLRTDSASSNSDLQARYDSIVQRIDALQLIANTVENSRDGLTEGTLRRISSELGVLLDGRRRRIEDARARAATTATGIGAGMSPSPLGYKRPVTAGANCDDDDGLPPLMAGAHSRRSFSMDPAEIRRAVMRAVVEQPAGDALVRNSRDSNGINNTSNRSTSSNGSSRAGSPRRVQTPGCRRVSVGSGSGPGSRVVRPIRRDSISTAAAAVGSDTDSTHHQQLTPQTRRQGGILKAGRTRRAMPTARLPGSSGPDYHGVATSNGGAASASTTSSSSTPRRASGSESAGNQSITRLPPPPPSLSQPRTPKSAGARKRVRFPEEQRLLETIRLVDPQIAQSIETRAAAAASLISTAPQQRVEPVASASATIVPGKIQLSAGNARWSDNDSEEEERVTGLAARVRSSPRLSPKIPEDPSDSDSNSSDSLVSPASCRFNTATSVLFDEATDLPITLPLAPPAFKRPPLPRPSASLHMVLGHDHHQQQQQQQQQQPGLPEPLLSESKQGGWKRRASLAVGPNVGSAQSSPVVAPSDQYPLLGGEGSNISSPLSDVAVFGGDYEDGDHGCDQGSAATARLWS
ncbi:hypothetical protein IWW48_000589 [Coemansia sp. RSA 1200]|nr:hypothetical protein IWW48_000589 [Coemansia sp. RSA 1200]